MTGSSAMYSSSLRERIEKLESVEEIRQLKARYWRSCDRKDHRAVLDCFVAGEVEIDYGPIGFFSDRESFVKVFRALGCKDNIVDMHHGANPEIERIDAYHANGIWDLYFFTIDTDGRTFMQLAGRYEDRYLRLDGEWKIESTRFVAASRFGGRVGADGTLSIAP
ncbi:nuclear transport factor 2 family protein [Marinobacterium aestuariivivens]|uniref:Nuclear transport factor 2 family protein n=1 Tax=Marinobacterium aestuariivivens TaxID=1698799 RepID=A0ABW2A420_9GAMM